MNTNISATNQSDLTRLRELSARIGNDPLLTQASTGNSSIKLSLERFFPAGSSTLAKRFFRPRAAQRCSVRFRVPIPKTNRRVDFILSPS